MNARTLDLALRYAKEKFAVIPCQPMSKTPSLDWKTFQTARPTQADLRSWFGHNGTHNLAILCGKVSGNLVVVDFDDLTAFDEWAAEHPDLAQSAPIVATSRGRHVYLRTAKPLKGYKAEGADVRADGGYVIAPPSIHPTGAKYQLVSGDFGSIPTVSPDELPSPLEPSHEAVTETISEGRRNDHLIRVAGGMRRRGMGESAILEILRLENRENCRPPLEDEEVRRIAASVAKYPPSEDGEAPGHDVLRDRWLDSAPPTCYGLGDWRRYAGGAWGAVKPAFVQREIQQVIEEARIAGEYIRPTAALLASVTELAKVKVFAPDESFDANSDLFVFANGTFDLARRQLREHSPQDYCTLAVPYAYDPKATAPTWKKILMRLEKATPGLVGFIQEFSGYCQTADTRYELALWLTGKMGSGRSTFLTGLETMLGPRAGVLGLAEVERSRFALTGLIGKTLVTATEQPTGFVSVAHILNAVISGEPVIVERKFQEPFTLRPHAKIAWAMNDLPRVSDPGSGLFRRVKVVRFPDLDEKKRDPGVKERIKHEGPGIFNWALEGLTRLRERGRFEIPSCVVEATDDFQQMNDVPAVFLAECCTPDKKTFVRSDDLYQAYSAWCEWNGHRAQSRTSLAGEWERLGLEKDRDGKGVVWRGIKFVGTPKLSRRQVEATAKAGM